MSPVKRRKSAAQEAPISIEQATAMIAEYHALMLKVEEIHADAATSIAQIEGARDLFAAPIAEKAKALFLQLRTWWAVAGPTLTDGKRKSIDLAGCKIGIRTSTPSLGLPKGLNAETAVDWLKGLADGLGARFIRVKESLDKAAIITLLGKDDDPDVSAFRLKGFSTKQAEEFFIDTARKAEADPVIEEATQ